MKTPHISLFFHCTHHAHIKSRCEVTGSDALYLQYELLQLRLFVFHPLQSSLPLGLQETHRITSLKNNHHDTSQKTFLRPTDLQILTFLRRVGGEPDPFDLLLVFGDDVHGHQDVQGVVNPSADVLLIVHVLEEQKHERVSDGRVCGRHHVTGTGTDRLVRRDVVVSGAELGHQLVRHLVVGRHHLLLHLLTHFHGEMPQTLPALIALPAAPAGGATDSYHMITKPKTTQLKEECLNDITSCVSLFYGLFHLL